MNRFVLRAYSLSELATPARSAVTGPGSASMGPSDWLAGGTQVIRRRNVRRAVVDDDFRELEPHISDHPFQPGSWPDACGYVDEHGWTCGYTRAEHTHISGEEPTPPLG